MTVAQALCVLLFCKEPHTMADKEAALDTLIGCDKFRIEGVFSLLRPRLEETQLTCSSLAEVVDF